MLMCDAIGEMMDVFDHEFYKDGFLMKELNISSMLITEGVVPSLDEMQRFQQGMNDEVHVICRICFLHGMY